MIGGHRLKSKIFQREFAKNRIEFLGHIVSSDRVEIDPKMGITVRDAPAPFGKTSLKIVFRLEGYYRNFIKKNCEDIRRTVLCLIENCRVLLKRLHARFL